MKKRNKALLVLACAGCLIIGSVFGTLAYLTDEDAATNTFTVGKVEIELDEADVDDSDGDNDRTDRDKANKYHLLPGHTYVKDPTVTVKEDSEDSYVRMLMTVYNAGAVQAIINADDEGDDTVKDYADLFSGWSENIWKYEGFEADEDADTITFEFRYCTTVNDQSGPNKGGVLEPLFTEIVVPGYVTNDHLAALYGEETDAEGDFIMEIVAHAIQAAGFETEDAAWDAFDKTVQP